MSLATVARAADLLHGALDTVAEKDGWVRPQRFAPAQLRALGSVRAWHPGLYRAMASCTAGVAVEFSTDATRARIEVRMDEFPRGTGAVLADVAACEGGPTPPYDGVSVEIDGRLLPPMVPDERGVVEFSLDDPLSAPEPGLVRLPLPGMGEPHRVRAWLPCLTSCAVREVSADGTYLEPVAPRGTLLVLGDSVAQGFVSCGGGGSWTALLAAHLGLDLLNQGVGGQVFQPGSLAGLSELVRPDAIVVEFGENYRYEPCQASRVEREALVYLYEVAEAWPDVPTWVLTPLPHLEERYPTNPRSCADAVEGIICAAAARHPQMRLVNGSALLDADDLGALLADGSDHPSPAGQRMLAERLSFVVDATWATPEQRRTIALAVCERAGSEALPVAEALRRGIGEVLLADKGAVIVAVPGGSTLVWASRRGVVGRALTCLGARGVVTVCGERRLAREVVRAVGGTARPCHLVTWAGDAPAADAARDVRVLTSAYAGAIREHYAHPEYLAPGELEALLDAGAFLGGFEEGRLVGFVGEHADGSMGMLEVFEPARRRGWGTTLAAAKVAATVEAGNVAWAAVWPDNDASLALERSMGFSVADTGGLWYVS